MGRQCNDATTSNPWPSTFWDGNEPIGLARLNGHYHWLQQNGPPTFASFHPPTKFLQVRRYLLRDWAVHGDVWEICKEVMYPKQVFQQTTSQASAGTEPIPNNFQVHKFAATTGSPGQSRRPINPSVPIHRAILTIRVLFSLRG
jgi:hypothetical protein